MPNMIIMRERARMIFEILSIKSSIVVSASKYIGFDFDSLTVWSKFKKRTPHTLAYDTDCP